MSNFDVVAHLKSNVYADEDVTEAPNSLIVVEEVEGEMYVLDPLSDESSLLWVYLTSDTFDEFLPGYHWCVDNPGTIYPQTEGAALSVETMQPVADELLKRYRAVVEHLRAEGREIYSD